MKIHEIAIYVLQMFTHKPVPKCEKQCLSRSIFNHPILNAILSFGFHLLRFSVSHKISVNSVAIIFLKLKKRYFIDELEELYRFELRF